PLSQAALQRIIDDSMLPKLKQDDIAGGLAAGLDATASQITNPVPVAARSPGMETLARWVRLPLNLLALAGALAVGWLISRLRRARPRSSQPIVATANPPSDTPPATVGALVQGRITDSELAGAILELGRRGPLSVEPESKSKIRIQLGKRAAARTEVEAQLWDALARLAGPDGVVDSGELARLPHEWRGIKETLREQLIAAGLYNARAADLRRPGYLVGAAALIGATVLGILAIASREPWGAAGAGALAIAGIAVIIYAYDMPGTTEAGETEAAHWRGYLAGLKDLGRRSPASLQEDVDLDVALPYLLAMGKANLLNKRLKEASEAGFNPAWLSRSLQPDQNRAGFYPVWVAYMGSLAPTSSGAGSMAGGAAAGGGGAGGSF
ncbi:MAG TPA: hypothetical protein VFU72_00495, partial [Nitrolancea sp.]|nr:hypothetical protein [Nitrolancea sp.]